MKKILSLLCATALLTNVFAVLMTVKADEPTTPTTPTVLGTSFEELTVGDALDPVADDTGKTTEAVDDGEFHWIGVADDTGTIKAYGDETPYEYSGSNNRADGLPELTGANEKYLALETSDRLLRTYNVVDKTAFGNGVTNAAPVSLADADLYADLLVKFTGSEERPALKDGDKIAVWFKTVEADLETETVGETNLVITAGYFGTLDGTTYTPCASSAITSTVTNRDYIVALNTPIDPEKWYRLTIKAANNVMASDTVPGFIVYLDGVALAATAGSYDIGGGLSASSFDAANAVFFGAKQLFPSLVKSDNVDLAVTGLSLAGTGSIDDLSLNTLAPNFAVPDTMFTLTWAPGLESLSYAIDDGSATPVANLASGSQVIPLTPGYAQHTITITETYADGYKYRASDWTAGDNTTLNSKTFTVDARPAGGVASGAIVPFKAFFEVDGTEYAIFSQAYAAALAAEDNTITVVANAEIDSASGADDNSAGSAVIKYGETITINLNGKTLTGNGANPAIVNLGGSLTIYGGTLAGANGALDASAGTTTITSGTIGSVIGATGATLTITGGSFFQQADGAFYLLGSVNTLEYKATRNNDYYDVAAIEKNFMITTDDGSGPKTQYYATFDEAIDGVAAGGTIKLCKDLALTSPIYVGKEMTLDLNGKTISATGALTATRNSVKGSSEKDSLIIVTYGGDLTLMNGTVDCNEIPSISSAVKMTSSSETYVEDQVASAKLTVEDGTILIGYYYAISGNGNRHNTEIVINGGSLTAEAPQDNIGIYNPQNGSVEVNGGTITGYSSAIEMRGGLLTVTDGTLTATAPTYSCNANGNGSTTVGAAIAIAQHTTKQDLAFTIEGGVFIGEVAISESNPQANDPAPSVAMSITDGDFTGDLTITDVPAEGFIEGGTFSVAPAVELCGEGLVPSEGDGVWEIVEGIKIKFETAYGTAPATIGCPGEEYIFTTDAVPAMSDVSGWAFAGWKYIIDGEIYVFESDKATYYEEEGAEGEDYTETFLDEGFAFAEDTTLTAVWTSTEEPAGYDVVLDIANTDYASAQYKLDPADEYQDYTGTIHVDEGATLYVKWIGKDGFDSTEDTFTDFATVIKTPTTPAPALPFQVIIADASTYYPTFAAALAAANAADPSATIILNEDVTTAGKLAITGNVTIDLNGKMIAQDQTVVNKSGVLIVAHGGTLTINDSSDTSAGKIDGGAKAYAAVAMTGTGDTDDTKTATLVVNAGTLQGHYYGIVGNGTAGRGNTSVTINGGLVQGTNAGDCIGIYNPQEGTVAVTGGTIKGDTGIYAKGGSISVTGGEVIGNGASKAPVANGNGADPTGDAIVLDTKEGYAGDMSLMLGKDATITSANGYAVRETVTQGNKSATLALTDNGATLAGELGGTKVSDDFTAAIDAGTATIAGYTIAIDGVCGNDSLLAAIGKVADNGTITLLANVTDATGISIDSKKTFTVDFNGFTYTVNKPGAGSTGTATQAFQLLKGQTITFKNGTINAAADNLVLAVAPAKNIKRFFQSYADLTLENMTLDGTNLYLNPADNAVCEFANGTVALTGSTSIDAPENCIAVSVDNWKGKYPDGVDVTIDTTGTIDGVKVWTEGTGDATAAALTLTAGTITELTVEGEDTDFAVSKTGATVTAPEGYEWDDDGKLVEDVPAELTTIIADQEYNAETNPYVIRDAADFTILANDVALGADSIYASATIVMTNDVDATSLGAFAGIGQAGGTMAGVPMFKGTFDGQGFKIYNLTLQGAKYAGFFNTVSGATIKDLTIELAGFVAAASDNATGVFVGSAAGSTLKGLTAKGADLTGLTHKSGGICGKGIVTVFESCTNYLNIAGSNCPAGICSYMCTGNSSGYEGKMQFIDCVNYGDIELTGSYDGGNGAAGIAAYVAVKADPAEGATFDRCVNLGEVTVSGSSNAAAIAGTVSFSKPAVNLSWSKGLLGQDAVGFNSGSDIRDLGFNLCIDDADTRTWYADAAVEAGKTYTLLANAAPVIVLEAEETISFVKGDFELDTDGITSAAGVEIADNEGTVTVTGKVPALQLLIADQPYDPETNPYTINVAQDIVILQNDVAKGAGSEYFDKAIVQTADIDATELGTFTGIGKAGGTMAGVPMFKGTYDGQGFKIYNLTLYGAKYSGFFNTVSGATIKDLTIELAGYVPAAADNATGVFCGSAAGSTLKGLTAKGIDLTGLAHKSAGFCGKGIVTVFESCTNYLNIAGSNCPAGICSYMCTGNSSGYEGKMQFIDCVNYGDIELTGAYDGGNGAAGIAAYVAVKADPAEGATFDRCVNLGEVTVSGSDYAAAIAGTVSFSKPAVNLSWSKGLLGQDAVGFNSGSDIRDLGFNLCIDDAETRTWYADNAVEAGKTYTLLANAAPVIELDVGDSITFDKNGFDLTATGITAAEGAKLDEPEEAGDVVIYSASEAVTDPLPPAVDDAAVEAILADAPASLKDNITTKKDYDAFLEWVEKNHLIHEEVKDSEMAFFSYALGQDSLVDKDAVTPETVKVSEMAMDGGKVRLTVSIDDITVDGDAKPELLSKIFGAVGNDELVLANFEKLNVKYVEDTETKSLMQVQAGDVVFDVTYADKFIKDDKPPKAFFYRAMVDTSAGLGKSAE